MTAEAAAAARAALTRLPDRDGGIAVVLATASLPPAMALLSSGDVHWEGDTIRVGVHASSSAVSRLGGGFTLLVPHQEVAYRVEVTDATATVAGMLACLEGSVRGVRPTAEPPWQLEMRFRPRSVEDERLAGFVDYWRGVRAWLSGKASPPHPPP